MKVKIKKNEESDFETQTRARDPMLEHGSYRELQDLEEGHARACDLELERSPHSEDDSRFRGARLSASLHSQGCDKDGKFCFRINLLGNDLEAYLKDLDVVIIIF